MEAVPDDRITFNQWFSPTNPSNNAIIMSNPSFGLVGWSETTPSLTVLDKARGFLTPTLNPARRFGMTLDWNCALKESWQ